MEEDSLENQVRRLLTLFLYIGLMFLANYLAFGQVLPINGPKGVWFYSGMAGLLLGNMLVAPYYTKPVDSISNGVASIIALYSIHTWDSWISLEKITFIIATGICIIAIGTALLSIILKDSPNRNGQNWANTFRIVSDTTGNATTIFGILTAFALIVFHRDSASEILVIGLAWVTVSGRPEQLLSSAYSKIKNTWRDYPDIKRIGDIAAYCIPNIALVRQSEHSIIPFGQMLLIKDNCGPLKMGVALDCVGRDESLLIRVITKEFPAELLEEAKRISGNIPYGSVMCYDVSNNTELVAATTTYNLQNCIGIVSTETSLEELYFEVIQADGLEEGKLVQVLINNKPVLYQVLNGLTKEETVYKKNTFGFVKAKAQKIGIWKRDEKRFTQAKWMPVINSPVHLVNIESHTLEPNAIGHFPGTDYNVSINNIHQLVTHNTAILGILGVGKSMLAIELIERLIAEKIKVICLDLTDQYAMELQDFYEREEDDLLYSRLTEIGQNGRKNAELNVEEGGSVKEFSSAIKEDLKRFICEKPEKMIKIFNPLKFEVWRQDSRPYQGQASMATLTPTEVTRIISESALEIVQGLGMTEKARVCLVYEEAHSLIPEWNSVAAESDRAATNGTARAILQGRKFGLGCLVITQRTANVTKTILNQCNTIFAMRTFDDTGKEFLANYLGSEYASVLPSLKERHAVFFGKASSCENPVLIRLNDKSDFRHIFRKVHPVNDKKRSEKLPRSERGDISDR